MRRFLTALLLLFLTCAEVIAVGMLVNLNFGHSRRVEGAWVKWYEKPTPENARELDRISSRVQREYLVLDIILGIFAVGNSALITKAFVHLRRAGRVARA